jgi:hypothetical protein
MSIHYKYCLCMCVFVDVNGLITSLYNVILSVYMFIVTRTVIFFIYFKDAQVSRVLFNELKYFT